jgi:hypothetical protein
MTGFLVFPVGLDLSFLPSSLLEVSFSQGLLVAHYTFALS